MNNILIVGHGRSGKDTAAEFLHGRGALRYAGSTSWFALPHMAQLLRLAPQSAWQHRHKYRQNWKTACDEFRRYEPLRLVRMALQKGNIVTGVRDRAEMDAVKASGLFDSILWVERPTVEVDPTVMFTSADATDIIVNDETLTVLEARILRWAASKQYL